MKDEVKEIFLTAIQERLQTTLAVLDFKTSMIDQVIYQMLDMDRTQNCNNMLMGALQWALPKEEDLQFR